MTREEAIRVLEAEKKFLFHGSLSDKHYEPAFDMAIEALHREEAEAKGYCHRIIPKVYEDYEHATLVDIKEPLKVAVVRCKDCRHRDLFSCPLADNDFQKDDDYCSWGERREPLNGKSADIVIIDERREPENG